MARNFDEERKQDMDFIIRGEKFTMRMVRPEVIGAWEDEPTPEKSMDSIAYTSDKIKNFLLNSDGSHERWDALRQREDDAISLGELGRAPDLDDRGPVLPPYAVALTLGTWAWANRSLIEGRVALAGGNPDDLSLKHFLDCGHALLVEAFLRTGTDLLTATSEVEKMVGLKPPDVLEDLEATVPGPSDNDAALAELASILGGVQR